MPTATRAAMSRPNWSVPNQYCADGPCSAVGNLLDRVVRQEPESSAGGDDQQERRHDKTDAAVAVPPDPADQDRSAGGAPACADVRVDGEDAHACRVLGSMTR